MAERHPPDISNAAISGLLFRFLRASLLLHEATARCGAGLPPQQANAAMVLVTRDGLTVRELAEAMGVSPGWASRLADELVESGFVIRERDGADRRIVRLRLAPEARAQIDEVGRQRAEAVARALEGVPAANRAVLATLLDRISSEFERLASLERGRSSGSTRG